MVINKLDRYKILINHLKDLGVIESQQDFGRKLGYNNPSAFSQVINGKAIEPKQFTQKIKELYPPLNEEWLLTGEGEMLVNSGISASIDGSHNQINGHGAHGNFNGCESSAILSERVKSLEALLAEKERLIKVLMEGRK